MSWLANLEMFGVQSLENNSGLTQRSPNGVMGGDYDIQAKAPGVTGNLTTPFYYQFLMGYDSK